MSLPIHYAITDPLYYSSDPLILLSSLKRALSLHRIDWITLRDKRTNEYECVAEAFVSLKKEYPKTKFFLHTNTLLAHSLGADGIHLPSSAIEDVADAKEKGLFTIVSTHSIEEALQAERLGADAITFSPIFSSPGKGEPQGLEKLKEIKDRISIKLIALGGIVTLDQIRSIELAGADGFASIRYFIQGNENNERI